MRYVLDTDAISALVHRDGRLLGRIGGIAADVLAVTVVSLGEQVAGRLAALHGRLRP